MESLNLLKEEINQTLESEHDFAKWKLIVAAGLGATALGLGQGSTRQTWLLLFIPFACAYIDLHISQYQARILVLAQFIRRYYPTATGYGGDTALQDYEKYVHQLRASKGHFFDLGQFAHRLASFGLSLAGPVVVLLVLWQSPPSNEVRFGHKSVAAIKAFLDWVPTLKHYGTTAVWLVGIAAIWAVWHSHSRRLRDLHKGFFNISSQRLSRMIQPLYSLNEIEQISSFLEEMGTLNFPALPNGLFPAAAFAKNKDYTGYSYVWVRDNVHIAHAHYVVGNRDVAIKNLRTLMQYFTKHQTRFARIIKGEASASDPMNRPHIRFDGITLEEISQKWAHAQNDALGYFLWMFCKLVNEGAISPSPGDLSTLDLFPSYFAKIEYWKDEDSGHWEETRKISASSIGAVVAGLEQMQKLLDAGKFSPPNAQTTADSVKALTSQGRAALNSILPAECVQQNPSQQRRYDAALLFLIYPLQVVDNRMADQILKNTRDHLQGDYGIRRYPGDSYWAPDYKKKLAPSERTADFSEDLTRRDQLLPSQGEEAQWTLFDPIISCAYGTRFRTNTRGESLACQTEYLNRSLGQITSETSQDVLPFRCPELYYLENGRYVPNDHVPLLWTEANLMLSLWFMKESCKCLRSPVQSSAA
jgi:phosphorylase kinase alpha/beta subunit